MHWIIDYQTGVPVYLQLMQQVKSAVASGTLRSGDQLPSVRAMAEELRVNRNTVARAWADLEGEGVIVNRQGLGCFVSEKVTLLRKSVRTERLSTALDQVVVQAHHLQVSEDTLRALLDERIRHFHQLRKAQGD